MLGLVETQAALSECCYHIYLLVHFLHQFVMQNKKKRTKIGINNKFNFVKEETRNLLISLLELDPNKRLTASQALQHKAVIPIVPVKDSLRIIDGNTSKAVARENFRAVQTPQVFLASLLKESFKMEGYENYTDEASLVEASGHPIHLVNGEESNIKITVPADLVFAEAMLMKR